MIPIRLWWFREFHANIVYPIPTEADEAILTDSVQKKPSSIGRLIVTDYSFLFTTEIAADSAPTFAEEKNVKLIEHSTGEGVYQRNSLYLLDLT